MRSLTVFLIAGLFVQVPATTDRVKIPISEERGLRDWELDGNGGWSVRGQRLILEKAGVPSGPIRRPAALAIFRDRLLTDFELQVDVRSTAPPELAVRDVLLIFGYQSATQFYYVHLAAKTDPVHNGIFLVNNADRRRLDDASAQARLIDQAWHHIRLERQSARGTINVFFGDDPTPLLSTTDRTLGSGRIGVGSFDETGEFRAFEVRELARR
jgi:hypothetical protein